MKVRLLGTGAADGWPNPFCTCPSCAAQSAAGEVRATTSTLVDDALLVDAGRDVLRAAARQGVPLHGVRHLLLTHDHYDHVDGAVLLARSRAEGRQARPLTVLGPPGALDELRPWLGPRTDVVLRPVAAGDEVSADGYVVRALAATHPGALSGEALLYDITGPDGSRLLYATDTGPFGDATTAATRGAAYDLVLLDETHGTETGRPGDHLHLASFAAQVAALRGAGAVTEATEVVAVHLDHGNPPEPELRRLLGAWGARPGRDGEVLDIRGTGAAASTGRATGGGGLLPRRTLVLGGARSGKSLAAEQLLASEPHVVYVATSDPALVPADEEWAARVREHQRRRPATWTTLETAKVADAIRGAGTPVLVDCLSLWLGAFWEAAPAERDDVLAAAVDDLVDAWRHTAVPVVVVSNEVGSGVVPATASGRWFRDALGALNARVAAHADEVLLMVAGRAVRL